MKRYKHSTREVLPSVVKEDAHQAMVYDGRSKKCIVEFANKECLICVFQIMVAYDKMDKEEPYYCGCSWLDEERCECHELDESISWEYIENEGEE